MKLSAAVRNRLKASVFAGPGRSYPITDFSHAAAAIRDSAHAENVGNIDERQRAAIVRKAKAYIARHGREARP